MAEKMTTKKIKVEGTVISKFPNTDKKDPTRKYYNLVVNYGGRNNDTISCSQEQYEAAEVGSRYEMVVWQKIMWDKNFIAYNADYKTNLQKVS